MDEFLLKQPKKRNYKITKQNKKKILFCFVFFDFGHFKMSKITFFQLVLFFVFVLFCNLLQYLVK